MKCPMCGEMNKLATSFCEYCGARLEPHASDESSGLLIGVPALICATCGAIVLPGETKCDNCGHAIAPLFASNNQTSAKLQVVDLPREGFAETAVDMNEIHMNPESSGISAGIEYRIENSTPISNRDEIQTNSDVVHLGVEISSQPTSINDEQLNTGNPSPQLDLTDGVSGFDAPSAAEYVVTNEAPVGAFDGDVHEIKRRRQELEEEITRQREIMKQLDHMRRAFREVTPQAVLMGLAEAEEKLKSCERELERLPILPEIDPLVIERLHKDLARQIEIIEQFEQLQRTFASATPRAVLQGIIDARQTEESIRAELLGFGLDMIIPRSMSTAVPAVPPIAVPPIQAISQVVVNMPSPTPSPVAAIVPTHQADMLMPVADNLLPTSANPIETAVNPVNNPMAPAARLQLESGTIVPLPSGRREIIIGRDDPISGVHPEIDMTPYGAESGGISRRHVRLSIIDGQWMITDLQSTNHTRVNGVRIDPGVPTLLPDSAQVVLGRIGFIFRSS